MTITIRLVLSIILVPPLLATGLRGQQCKRIHVPQVKSIFAIAPSPSGTSVLFYGSSGGSEGEIVTGKLFKLLLNQGEGRALPLKAPDATNPSAPAWQPNGEIAYFETDQGVYQLQTAYGAPEPLWKGLSVGLAISPDGLFLAFWGVRNGTDTLVVYDIKKRLEMRTWFIPDRFESDKAGWDLAFAPDGHFLYARTYDEPSSTPLKRFDIGSGKVEVVIPDCYSVADSKKAVYFIAAADNARSLHKIESDGHSLLVTSDYHYDSLSGGRTSRWLVSQDYRSRELAVLDTETDSIQKVGKGETAAVLPDGRLLVVKAGEITVGDASCRPME